MKVCLDCTPLLVRSAGVKTYLYYLREALRATAAGRELVCFPFLENDRELRHDESPFGKLGNLVRAGYASRLSHPWNPVFRWSARGAAVFHASNLVKSAPRGCVLTTTVHDLTALTFREWHTAQTIQADHRFFTTTVRRARRVIAVSEQTKRDLIEATGITEERVRTIYSGVREVFFQVRDGAVQTAHEKYGLARPYVLFVGTLEPRKNIRRLLDAWAGMSASLHEEFELVFAGMTGWLDAATRERLEQGEAGARRLGYVAEEDMPAIVAGATVFAYPSLYEGFGFPVVEAMAAVTSGVSSLPEVGGEAACYVDPLSVDEIRTALERLLTSPAERSAMSERGRVQARKFSWTECARQTWKVFEEATEG